VTSFASLPRPTLTRTSGIGSNCTSTLAVDGRGVLWTEHGCEARSSGIRRHERMTEAARAQFREALEPLRQLTQDPLSECSANVVAFTLVEESGAERTWYVCGPPWPQPFDRLVSITEMIGE
jgi:hypothetical protein